MADFAEWIVAAEPALPWASGDFLKAYQGNQQDANDLTLEASPVAQAVREFMSKRRDPGRHGDRTLGELEAITERPNAAAEVLARQWADAGKRCAGSHRICGPWASFVTFGERKHGGTRIIRRCTPIPNERAIHRHHRHHRHPALQDHGNGGDRAPTHRDTA